MLKRSIVLASSLIISALLLSCGSINPGPVLIGDTQTIVVEGEKVFAEAATADREGKVKKAIKLYDKTATEYSFAKSASNARYRQAQLLDQLGKTKKAFKAYDEFLQSFPSSTQYSLALRRLAEIAHAAARGEIQTSFFGIKSDLPVKQTVEMLGKVRDHAPRSATAARAQYAIGEAYLSKKKYKEAVAAFRTLVSEQADHVLSPVALFRVGKILLETAERGNQNQATIDLSREAFNDYLIQYPNHSRNAEARKMIAALDRRELERSFDIAEFYLKTDQVSSAKVYYRDIVKNSKSGKLHDAAQARLKEIGN